MTITWLGHSCFQLESGGWRVVLDPYSGVPGYPPLQIQANRVLCSHEHYDHNFRQAVQLLLETLPSPFSITSIASWHDDVQGKKRGPNTIHLLQAENLRILHLGDLGTLLTPEQLLQIGHVDIVLLPVGGTYTIDPQQARQVARQLNDPAVLPMHYRRGPLGFPELQELEEFLSLYPSSAIQRLSGPIWQAAAAPGSVIVPCFSE